MGLITQEIEAYCINHSSKPSELAKELQEFTRTSVHGHQMLIGELEASVIQFLIKLGGIKSILELGTYTGYSALIMAEALPEHGKITTIDINQETTKIAQTYWSRSPHAHKIKSLHGPGLEVIKNLQEKFDLIFIDADKNNYPHYLAWSIEHLSESGIIIVDNTLWSGKVLTPGLDKQTDSIILHNQKAHELKGYIKTLLPIRDGMFLIRRE